MLLFQGMILTKCPLVTIWKNVYFTLFNSSCRWAVWANYRKPQWSFFKKFLIDPYVLCYPVHWSHSHAKRKWLRPLWRLWRSFSPCLDCLRWYKMIRGQTSYSYFHTSHETAFPTAYHQGAIQHFHQTLKSMLHPYCQETSKDWNEGVHLLLFASREVVQESLGFSWQSWCLRTLWAIPLALFFPNRC